MGLRFEKIRITGQDIDQGVTKRCRLSQLTNSALVYEPKCGGRGGGCGVSANELTPYLTYDINPFKHPEMQTEKYGMLIRKAVTLFI
jgi:hypothetical protein